MGDVQGHKFTLFCFYCSKSAASTAFCADDEKPLCFNPSHSANSTYVQLSYHLTPQKKPLLHRRFPYFLSVCHTKALRYHTMSCLFRARPCDLFKGHCGFQSSLSPSVFKLLLIHCNAQQKQVLAISTKWNSTSTTLKLEPVSDHGVNVSASVRAYLQDQDLAAVWASHNSWLPRISPSFWAGVPVVLSMVVEKSCRKWFLPVKRNCSGLSVLSSVGLWANIQLEILASEAAGRNLALKPQNCEAAGWYQIKREPSWMLTTKSV